MITLVLGLVGALTYGVADFLGGLASRRLRTIVVTSAAAVIGIVPLLVGLAILGGTFSGGAILWGSVAGIAGSIGLVLLYSALAIGPMSVLSPVTSVFSALLPVVVAVLLGTRLSGIAIAALVVALIAVALVASVPDHTGARLTTRGLLAAVIAGCGFGGLVLAYNQTSPADGVAPLVVARIVQSVLLCGIALATRRAARGTQAPGEATGRLPWRFWAIVAICGVFDALANVFIQAALHSSTDPATLPIVSVLNALYPIGTVILAGIVLRERMTALQVGGIGLGIAASVVLALN